MLWKDSDMDGSEAALQKAKAVPANPPSSGVSDAPGWTPGPWTAEPPDFDLYFEGHPCFGQKNPSGCIHVTASRNDAEWELMKEDGAGSPDGLDIVLSVLIDDWEEPVYTPELRRMKATAQLAAAAPDLYAALALYVEHFGDPLKVARAALLKARGSVPESQPTEPKPATGSQEQD